MLYVELYMYLMKMLNETEWENVFEGDSITTI